MSENVVDNDDDYERLSSYAINVCLCDTNYHN